MKVLILGSGFGLYGYLPALINFKDVSILLLDRYKNRFNQRSELATFYKRIVWIDNQKDILKFCEALIISLPPIQQFFWAKKALRYNNISHVLLEKPLASTPELAMNLISDLETSGKKFEIGYNFRYTHWGEDILRHSRGIKSITWEFKAHHYKQNIQTWKRLHHKGGGALRFYGIHLIALLSELGYSDINYSKIEAKASEAERWDAQLTKVDFLPCDVTIATNSDQNFFQVIDINGCITSLSDPFQTTQPLLSTFIDQRIPYLIKLLNAFFYEEKTNNHWYKATNFLWHAIEKRTIQQ